MNYNHQLLKAEKKSFFSRLKFSGNALGEDYSGLLFFAYIALVLFIAFVIF